MALVDRLKQRRTKVQARLDQWISRGFKGHGGGSAKDATRSETAEQVSEVADLNRLIAEQEIKDQTG